MSRSAIVAMVVCATLLAAATVGAATISGTAGNDTLRGGPAADRLSGKGGHDTLYGLAGNDVLTGGRGNDRLVGGPGADKLYGAAGKDVLTGGRGNDLLVGGPGADNLSCGAGKDTARGDERDTIASDCEVVKGVPTRQLPPPMQPPPAVTPGSYQGRTENGNPVFFTIRPDRTIIGWQVEGDLPNNCDHSPGGDWLVDEPFSIGDDGAFDARRHYSEPDRDVLYERGALNQWDGRIAGRFDTATSVSGTFAVVYELEQRPEFWPPPHIYCSTPIMRWSATLRPPPVAPVTPGSYQGQTENGYPVSLTVLPDRTFSGWLVVGDFSNYCGYSPGGAWFAATRFSMRDDGTFDAQPRWDGSIPLEWGALTHWHGRIAGRFQTATSVGGTMVMNFTLQTPEYPLHCATRYLRWSATLAGRHATTR